jgi:hypothetical protein
MLLVLVGREDRGDMGARGVHRGLLEKQRPEEILDGDRLVGRGRRYPRQIDLRGSVVQDRDANSESEAGP